MGKSLPKPLMFPNYPVPVSRKNSPASNGKSSSLACGKGWEFRADRNTFILSSHHAKTNSASQDEPGTFASSGQVTALIQVVRYVVGEQDRLSSRVKISSGPASRRKGLDRGRPSGKSLCPIA